MGHIKRTTTSPSLEDEGKEIAQFQQKLYDPIKIDANPHRKHIKHTCNAT